MLSIEFPDTVCVIYYRGKCDGSFVIRQLSKQKIIDCKTDHLSLFSPSDCALRRLVNAIMLLGLELSSLLVAVCAFLLAWYFFLCADTRDRFPPGPWKFPLLGNLPQIMWHGDIMKFCKAYRRKYGNVSYSYKLIVWLHLMCKAKLVHCQSTQ